MTVVPQTLGQVVVRPSPSLKSDVPHAVFRPDSGPQVNLFRLGGIKIIAIAERGVS